MGQDDVGRERGQFRRVPANLGGIGRGPAGVDAHVAADGPAQLPQALKERSEASLKFRIVRGCGQEHTDKAHPLPLLRARGERRDRHRAAGKSYEIAPPQDRSHAGQGIIPIKSSTLDAGRMRVARRQGLCPRWVMNGPKATSVLSPFDSQLRTLVGAARRSHSCQKRP
jgi:hypothetical protein